MISKEKVNEKIILKIRRKYQEMKKKIAAIFMTIILTLMMLTININATNIQENNGVIPLNNDVTPIQQEVQQTTTQTQEQAQQQATNTTPDLKNDATVNLVEIKDKELETLKDYQDSYGDNTYGLVAYLLNIIRIYSIPFGFVGIAISGIYRYIIGIRKLDVRDKGFGAMIGIITVMVICQILPLVFAIVVKGWRG
jgi:hypothetical protein